MELNLANIITIIVMDHLISLVFIYLLITRLVGARPLFPQRPPEPEEPEGLAGLRG